VDDGTGISTVQRNFGLERQYQLLAEDGDLQYTALRQGKQRVLATLQQRKKYGESKETQENAVRGSRAWPDCEPAVYDRLKASKARSHQKSSLKMAANLNQSHIL
jgi:hypothetical protein